MSRYSGEGNSVLLASDAKMFMFIGGISVGIFFVVMLPWIIGTWHIINYIGGLFK